MSDLDDLNFADELGENIDDSVEELSDPNYNLGYQIGYDAGFIVGFEQGQKYLMLENESVVYNNALTEVIAQVEKFNFAEKNDVIMVLRLLQRV